MLTFAFAKSETFSRFVYRVGCNFSVLLVLTFCVAADFAIKTKLQEPWINFRIEIIPPPGLQLAAWVPFPAELAAVLLLD